MYITLAISKRVEYVCKFFYILKKKNKPPTDNNFDLFRFTYIPKRR